jgi:hypothetical protein
MPEIFAVELVGGLEIGFVGEMFRSSSGKMPKIFEYNPQQQNLWVASTVF